MKRIVKALVAIGALGVVAHARPARACDGHQKTTMAKAETAQPEKAAKSKQAAKDAKAQPKAETGAQAKSVASARVEQR